MAEALDDGRLPDEQRGSFERHAAACDLCQRAIAEVIRLDEVMSALPEPALSDFHHRHERQRLLARAGRLQAETLATPAGRPWIRFALVGALVLAAGTLGARAIIFRSAERSVATVSNSPRYEVTNLRDAAWVNEESGTMARVTLSGGAAAFHVHKLGTGQRFLVAMPDGEIEVRGTRFVVDVENGATRYVVVMEGKVAWRRAGAPEELLIAGQRWDAPVGATEPGARIGSTAERAQPVASSTTLATSSAVSRAPASREPPPSRERSASPAAAQSVAAAPHVKAATPPLAENKADEKHPVESQTELSEASDLFARSVRALRAERYDEADALWQEFLMKHPRDARAEDVAFLRVVGRERSGDRIGATTLARAYLQRFPQGMRRREAESLSRRAP